MDNKWITKFPDFKISKKNDLGNFCYPIYMEKNSPKFPIIFKCELCNYKCSHKGDLKKHFNTQKHKMITLDNKKSPMDKNFICECGKTYKYASGISKHKKKCNFKINIEESGFISRK